MWTYKGQEVNELPDDCVGFVYLIVNLKTNRKYIGKKLSKFSRTKTVTVTLKSGIKKKKKVKAKIDSDWKTYYGSSDELKNDICLIGSEHFSREILFYCSSKGECSYIELREQILSGALVKPNEYYNSFVGGRIHRNHVKSLIET
jgi:hypothetical protein